MANMYTADTAAAAPGKAPNRARRIGVLGTGTAAWHHAAAASNLGHRIVAGVATSENSPRWQAFKEVAPDAAFVADGEALLADPDVDTIIAALPWRITAEWTERLLCCPKPVLIEKPLGLETAAIEHALDNPDATPDNKMVCYNRRFYSVVARLRERLAEGGLKSIQVTIAEEVHRQVSRHGTAVIPNLLAFSSSHMLDLLLHVFGPLRVVRLYGYDETGYPLPFRSVNGLLETETGVPMSFALNANDPSPAGIRCLFDDHTTWHLSPLETLMVFAGHDVVETRPGSQIRRYMPKVTQGFDEPTDEKPGFGAQMKEFLSGEIRLGATPRQSLDLHRFIETLQGAGDAE